jgi:hypothetical protein
MPAQLLTSVASLCTLHRPQFIVALHQAGRHVRCMPHPSLDINTPCSLACAVTPEPPQALLGAGPDHLMQSRHTPTVLRLTHRRRADHMRPRAATGSASRGTHRARLLRLATASKRRHRRRGLDIQLVRACALEPRGRAPDVASLCSLVDDTAGEPLAMCASPA